MFDLITDNFLLPCNSVSTLLIALESDANKIFYKSQDQLLDTKASC